MERANRKSTNVNEDIIDIDSTYEDFEASNDDDDLKINKNAKTKKDKDKIDSTDKDD